MDHASCHRDCRSGTGPGRLLLVFHGCLQAGAADRPGPARIRCRRAPRPRPRSGRAARRPARSPCPRPTAVSPSPSRMNKFQPVTVPVQVIRIPGDFTTPARPRSIPIRWSRNCSPPVRRRRPRASRDEAEKAEAAQGAPRRRRRRIAVPRPGPAAARPPADRLHRTKPARGLYGSVASCIDCDQRGTGAVSSWRPPQCTRRIE